MDTRRVSPGIRRRMGQSSSMYDQTSGGTGQPKSRSKLYKSTPVETDMSIIEGAFQRREGSS